MPRSPISRPGGVLAEPPTQPGPAVRTSWLTDPDGYRIELVQWPPGHPAGMMAADLPDRSAQSWAWVWA